MFVGMGANSGGGYNLESSLRFRSSASAYLERTPTTAGNRKTWTISFWFKRGIISSGNKTIYRANGGSDATGTYILLNSGDVLNVSTYIVGSGYAWQLLPNQLFRDPSAWYHLVVSVDTTQATASDRVKLYVNGEQITSFSTSNYPSLNYDTHTNNATSHYIGTRPDLSSEYFDGYLTEFNSVDGQALTPSDFGEYDEDTGVWKPKEYTGTYGTNGFYLDMSTSSSTVLDQSSNSNDWTANNMNLTTSSATTYDIMNDVPTLTDEDTGNFATMNPLYIHVNGYALPTFSNGNLTVEAPASNVFRWARASIFPTSGAYYYEMYVDTYGSNSTAIQVNTGSTYTSYTGGNGDIIVNGSSVGTYSTWTTGDTLGVALDIDNGDVTYYKNGTQVYTTSSQTYDGEVKIGHFTDYGGKVTYNFGQRPFAYTPPTGYKKLNTYNLPDSTIKEGSQYFVTALYTGNGTARSIDNTITDASGVETGDPIQFQPDLVWVKSRSNAYNNVLNDSVRGSTKLLISNGTDAEQTEAQSITSFNSNGFSLGTAGTWNQNASTFVAWNWKAGGTAVSNTDGTITSTVSANTTSGFSIVTYTVPSGGASFTVGHGLGVAPSMIITKNRGGTSPFPTWFTGFSKDEYVNLNTTAAKASQTDYWGSAVPTSTVFGNKEGVTWNASANIVAYCFSDVEGFSKFGSYTGNGSSDGPFIYTGFRPAFVMIKKTSSTYNWIMLDTSRDIDNEVAQIIYADLSSAEGTGSSGTYSWDFLSNGFKVRGSGTGTNQSSASYIYMAFAENPFKQSLAR